MSHISARSGFIACALVGASVLGASVASPGALAAASGDGGSAPAPAIQDEYIIQLEPVGGQSGAVSTDDLAAAAPDPGALQSQIGQVMAAVAQHERGGGGTNDLAANDIGQSDDDGPGVTNAVTGELASIHGFSATLTSESAEYVRSLDGVKAIYPNMELQGAIGASSDVSPDAATTSWALDRIDQADLPLDGTYSPPATGAGTHIYFVGTGFWADHEQFAGRVGEGVNLVTNEKPDDVTPACYAPGTRAASAAAGATLGVATAPTLHSMRILDCNGRGSFLSALRAVDWIAANAPARSVAYFGDVGGYFNPLNDAISYLERLGITTVVNGGTTTDIARQDGDACALSPASAPAALTVGASTEADSSADFSSTGNCIDLFAPGANVLAADTESPTATLSASDTSTAGAFVAGAVAMYLEQHPNDSPAQARAAVVAAAVPDRLHTADVLAPNRILNISKMDSASVPPTVPKPIAHIVQPERTVIGESIQFDGRQSQGADGGKALTYQWRRSDVDGVVSTVSTMTAKYENPGNYTVTLTVTDSKGVSATTFIWVQVTDEDGNVPIETSPSDEVVPNQYVVELAQPAELREDDLHTAVSAVMSQLNELSAGAETSQQVPNEVMLELESINGFSATLSDSAVDLLRSLPDVRAIYPNRVYRTQDLAGVGIAPMAARPTEFWGLDRIDQANLPGDGSYDPPNDGAGTHVYIVDQGIWADHSEFAGRLGDGFDGIGGATERACFEHGTHVAGIAAGKTAGVANAATLHSVRALGCGGSGTTANLLSGVDWIASNLQKPAVVNFSLGGPHDEALNAGVNYLASLGATVVVSAGNSRADACPISPAGSSEAITVAASGPADESANFTNYGRCVELYAPGVAINSASVTGPNEFEDKSGTSMASPFVAGAAALYLNLYPKATPAQVRDAIRRATTAGQVHNVLGDTPNMLLNIASMPAPDSAVASSAPVARMTQSGRPVAGRSFTFDGSSSTSLGGDPVTYEWRVSDSSKVAGTGPTLSYTFDDPGVHRVGLRVTNTAGVSSWTTADVEVVPTAAPIADSQLTLIQTSRVIEPVAVDDKFVYQVPADRQLKFDSDGTSDPNGGTVAIRWVVTYGTTQKTAYGRSFNYTFPLDQGQPLTALVTMYVTNAQGDVTTRVMQLDVTAIQPPNVVLTPPGDEVLYVDQGDSVTFDASKSFAPNGGPLGFLWKISGNLFYIGREPTLTYEFADTGRFTISVSVKDEFGVSVLKKVDVVVSVKNPQDPVIIIDPDGDQEITPGSTLTLDASQSNDPDGGGITFEWRVTGREGVVSKESKLVEEFPKQGVFNVTLTVTDNEYVRTSKTIKVTVAVENPKDPVLVMKPGEDQYVTVGSELTFDASESNDPDGGEVTFAWKTTGIDGVVSKEPKYTRDFPTQGRVGVEVFVTDDEGITVTKHIDVWVSVKDPKDPVLVMKPGEDQYVTVGSELTFDASESNDPDGGEVTFAWKTTGGNGVVSKEPKYTRDFPTQGRVGVEVFVTDDEGITVTKHIDVWVSVKDPKDPVLVMKPGEDQYVTLGTKLTFDAAGSYDPDGGDVTFAWYTTGKGLVSNEKTYTRSFDAVGRAGVELVVTDNEGVQVSKHIDVFAAKRQDPIADFDPGTPQTVTAGASLTFDGSQSRDPDGGALKYAWYTTGQGLVSTNVKHTFSFPTKGKFGVQLVVTDDEGDQAKKHIYVTVT